MDINDRMREYWSLPSCDVNELTVLEWAVKQNKLHQDSKQRAGFSNKMLADYLNFVDAARLPKPLTGDAIQKRIKAHRNAEALLNGTVKKSILVKDIKPNVLRYIQHHRMTDLFTLCKKFNVSPAEMTRIVNDITYDPTLLVTTSDELIIATTPKIGTYTRISLDIFNNAEKNIFGLTGDSHLCSVYERLDVLNYIYDIYYQEGVPLVFHTGNSIDGQIRFNLEEIHTHGLSNQADYLMANYPRRPGMETWFVVAAEHENWLCKGLGINLVEYLNMKAQATGRTDLKFIGFVEANVLLGPQGNTILRLVHPGGGTPYAVSHVTQKMLDSYMHDDRIQILGVGHHHKMHHGLWRGAYTLQTGCTCDPGSFMKTKNIRVDLGAWTCNARLVDDGRVLSFATEWIDCSNLTDTPKFWYAKTPEPRVYVPKAHEVLTANCKKR